MCLRDGKQVSESALKLIFYSSNNKDAPGVQDHIECF